MNHIVKKLTKDEFQQWLRSNRNLGNADDLGARFMAEKMQGVVDHDVDHAPIALAVELIEARYVAPSEEDDSAHDERFALPA